MRNLAITTAFFALASATGFPFTRASAQTDDPGRYAGPTEEPGIVVEEIPSSAAMESASPAAPLDFSGNGDQGWDVGHASEGLPSDADTQNQDPVSPQPPPPAEAQSLEDRFRSQPANDSAASESPRTAQPARSAKQWLAQMLAPPEGAKLSGEPLSLTDAMEGSFGRERQTEVLVAYWQLAVAVAKHYAAYEFLGAGGATPPARPAGPLDADLRQTELDAVRAQHKLARVLQWEVGRLPLPSSQPHAGSYNTRYDEIFTGSNSRRAWELDQSLPLMYELVKARADRLASAGPDADTFLRSVDAFLDIVLEYNVAIAEYAQLATGDSLTGRDLVPLLIRVHREDDHVAGSRERAGKTSRVEGRSIRPRRGAIFDPQVTRTSGERSVAPQSGATRQRPRVAQQEGRSPNRATMQRDQWRKQETPAR